MGLELEPTNGGGPPSLAVVGREIDQLVEEGDAPGLHKGARWAELATLDAKRRGAIEDAYQFVRIKIMAEAGIGAIHLGISPRWSTRHATGLEGIEVAAHTLSYYRTLGVARLRGVFDEAFAAYGAEDLPSLSSLCEHLVRIGVMRVPTKDLAIAVKGAVASSRLSGLLWRDVALEAGLTTGQIYHVLGGRKRKRDEATFTLALEFGRALGFDATSLPLVPPSPRTRRKPRMRKQRELKGGRLDKTYTLIRQALRELDAAVGESGKWGTAEAYDHLYQAEDIVGKALKHAK